MLSLIDILRGVLKKNQIGIGSAIDVGAHTGKFSEQLVFSKLFDRVCLFEPNPQNFVALKRRFAHQEHMALHNCGVGSSGGRAQLQFDSNTATGSLLPYADDYAHHGAVQILEVPVVSLDAFFNDFSYQRINLLKIDTQGFDLEVLRGAVETLAHHRPVVVVELLYLPLYSGQASLDEIQTFMREQGYVLHTLINIHNTPEGRIGFADGVFVPQEFDRTYEQVFHQIDNFDSWTTQLRTLDRICAERLLVINVLDAEVTRLRALLHAAD